jgi:hypothetical protein
MRLNRPSIPVIVLVAAGVALRLALTLLPDPNHFDVDSAHLIQRALLSDPLNVYRLHRYPYPPVYLPWVRASSSLASHTGLPFDTFFRVPAIAADVAIALVVGAYLGLRGATPSRRLAAVALVMLGPSFFLISGFHGQIDSLAGLAVLLSVVTWEAGRASRGWRAGLILGVGSGIKTVPILGVVALLPSARGWGERLRVVAVAAAIPVISLIPFLVVNARDTIDSLRYSGLPGVGGVGLLLQPGRANAFLLHHQTGYSALTVAAWQKTGPVVLLSLAVTLLVAWRRRAPALPVATALWLGVYAVSPTFFFQYVIWGLPIFLAEGHLKEVALMQLLLLGPGVVSELAPWHQAWLPTAYVILMTLAWLATVAAYGISLRRLWRWPRGEASAP